jgi:hypothetical protein
MEVRDEVSSQRWKDGRGDGREGGREGVREGRREIGEEAGVGVRSEDVVT